MPNRNKKLSATSFRERYLTKEAFKEYGKLLGWFLTFCGTLWIVAQMYLSGYVDEKIEEYDKQKQEEKASRKPLREILGDAMHIPSDIVPYYMAGKFAKLDSLTDDIDTFSEELLPHLEKEVNWITPRLMINPETKDHWWLHTDGEEYRVNYSHDGYGFIYVDTAWIPIYK